MNEEIRAVEKFKAMCEESVNPDLFSTLVEELIPALRVARKALKPLMGNYGETPKMQIGNFTICEFTLPPGDSIWIEDGEEDAMQFKKTHFERYLKEFYDKNF